MIFKDLVVLQRDRGRWGGYRGVKRDARIGCVRLNESPHVLTWLIEVLAVGRSR